MTASRQFLSSFPRSSRANIGSKPNRENDQGRPSFGGSALPAFGPVAAPLCHPVIFDKGVTKLVIFNLRRSLSLASTASGSLFDFGLHAARTTSFLALSNAAYCLILSPGCQDDASYRQNKRQRNGHDKPDARPLVPIRKPHVHNALLCGMNAGSGAKAEALDDAVLHADFSGPPANNIIRPTEDIYRLSAVTVNIPKSSSVKSGRDR
jgi:hypothetical protein